MTFNLVSKYYKTGRDFGILDRDPNDVSVIEKIFDADWNGRSTRASQGDDLVWSPGSESVLVSFIATAQNSLKIYNEEMEDPVIITALEEATARGVNVEVDMTYATNWKPALQELTARGVHVRTYPSSSKTRYIHAKVVIVDEARAFVGSENFSTNSFNNNRELGIIVSDIDILHSLIQTFDSDWQQSRPFLK